MPVLALISAGLGLLPQLISAGVGVTGLISHLKDVADAGTVSQEDWDKLHAYEDELRRKLNSDTE